MKNNSIILFFITIMALISCYADTEKKKNPHPNMSHKENIIFATPENPVTSPSGNYVLIIKEGFDDNVYNNCFYIYRVNDMNQSIYVCLKKYRTRDRLYFLWDEKDNVWVYSGDIGITLWLKKGNEWVENHSPRNDLPIVLQKVLKKQH